MRIGLVVPPWVPVPPMAYGGTEGVVDRLARGLEERGHDVILVAHPDSTCPVPTVSVLDHVDLGTMGVLDVELGHVRGAYRLLRLWKPDVVHDHTLAGPLHITHHPGRVRVATMHGPFESRLLPLFRAASGGSAIVAISRSQARTAHGVPIAAVIHHGVDVAEFPFGQGKGGYLLNLGRMAPEKGVHRAIAVARATGVPLLIASKMREPTEHEYYEQRVKPLLGGDVEYVGEVDKHEKLDLLAGAMALVNPIRWAEPFGMVMLESLACGTPVLAFAEGAAPEIVEHGVNGLLAKTTEEMAAAVDQVPALSREQCRRSASERFSTAAMVDAYVGLYQLLLESGLKDTEAEYVRAPGRPVAR